MPPDQPDDDNGLQREFDTLQAAHPELDPIAVLVLLATREHIRTSGKRSANTALLARKLDVEHALVRRSVAELVTKGWLVAEPVGGASPALRLMPCLDPAP